MTYGDFSKKLLQSAASDAPSVKSRLDAMHRIEQAIAGVGAAATATTSAASGVSHVAAASNVVWMAAKVAFVAGTIGTAIGAVSGYEIGRTHARKEPIERVTTEVKAHDSRPSGSIFVAPIVGSASASPARAPAESKPAAPDVCSETRVAPSRKCSTLGGRTVTFSLKSECARSMLDLYFVSEGCEEMFIGMVGPGEVFLQDTWDSKVFRVRDHTSHELVKEFVPEHVEGAPDRIKDWKGPPTQLPVVTIHDTDAPIPEASPLACSHGGGRAARIHVRNERKSGHVSLMLVDPECREKVERLIEPGNKYDGHTSEGHSFRVRDANGALLLDIAPVDLDTTRYVTVP